MNVTTYGLDVAKRVFQVHWVEPETGEVKRKRLARSEVSAFFARREPGVVAMEACGSAHHWGRLLQGLGQEVKLIAAQFVRPFVKTNKTDAADAEAIWEACQRPRMRFVAVKSAEQQAVLSLHRIRQQFVKIRTMQALQVRGLLYEFGVVAPQGWRALLAQAGPILADETRCPVPELVRRELLRQLDGLRALTTRIAELERQMGSWQRRESECQRIAAIPGVGRLTASAVVATVADARTFRSGREFAAFLGLVPRQSGTGGRVKLLKLNVAHILEGSVRKSGEKVRITAQLIKAADGSHLWSETYDRTLDDIFVVQDDIAGEVVKALKVTLLGTALATNTKPPDAEAYNLALQGRFFLELRGEKDVERAINYFAQSLKRDQGYAPAWSGLSVAYSWEADIGFAPSAEGYRRAREAAEKALRSIPDIDAHRAMGWIQEHLRLGLGGRGRQLSQSAGTGTRQR